jgi:hypothetical protein
MARGKAGNGVVWFAVIGAILICSGALSWSSISSALHGSTQSTRSASATGPAPQSRVSPSRTSSTSRSTSLPPTTASASAALSQLDRLPVVAARPHVGGYQRGCAAGQACSFGPAWTDDTDAPGGHNGCDSRDDLLRSKMTDVTFKGTSTCVVETGTYADPYTGDTVRWTKAKASSLQVDHVVPLALAWDLGASRWTQTERTEYANDEATVLLLASGPENEAKGDSGPGGWMPTNKAYACGYDMKFTSILAKYKLPVTKADKAAMTAVLATCA